MTRKPKRRERQERTSTIQNSKYSRGCIFACIGITDSHSRTQYYEARFFAFSKGLRDLAAWLQKYNYTEVCMERFLNQCREVPLLLIAPPPMKRGAWVPDDQLVAESVALARKYRALADRLGIQFADAGEWDVDLTYDGIHFSEEGHMCFAEGVAAALKNGQKDT